MSWIAQIVYDTVSSSTVRGTVSNYNGTDSIDRTRAEESIHQSQQRTLEDQASDYGNRDMLEGIEIDFLRRRASNNSLAVDDDQLSFGGQTILSSDPSAATLGEANAGVRPVLEASSPFFSVGALSISTAESFILDLGEQPTDAVTAPSNASLSLQPSLLDSAVTLSTTCSNSHQQSISLRTEQDRSLVSYEDVTDSRDVTIRGSAFTTRNSRTILSQRNYSERAWYAHFSEEDWQQLRRTAKMALKALNLGYSSTNSWSILRPEILPPLPPDQFVMEGESHSAEIYADILLYLPTSFICPYCQDALVGALTLDCDCHANICTACWEYHLAKKRFNYDPGFILARSLDYEVVPVHGCTQGHTMQDIDCPFCSQQVDNPLPCHALDVAILHIIQNFSPRETAFIQRAYYMRLKMWREEVIRRLQEPSSLRDEIIFNEYIMQLIQEEEKQLWGRRPQLCPSLFVPGLTTVSFFIAAVASLGVKVMLWKNQR